jgi:hypothetical protein
VIADILGNYFTKKTEHRIGGPAQFDFSAKKTSVPAQSSADCPSAPKHTPKQAGKIDKLRRFIDGNACRALKKQETFQPTGMLQRGV